MDIEKNKKNFIATAKKYIKRDGIDDLLASLETGDFFTAPASTRFHGAEDGGLCMHSMLVGKRLFEIAAVYDTEHKISTESLAIVALFHDLCKIGCYSVEMRNAKHEQGQWERVPYFKWDEQFHFGGHGDKSVFLVMEHMKLSREEAAAINSHMGFAGVPNIGSISDVYDSNLLAWMLHVADEAATYIDKY